MSAPDDECVDAVDWSRNKMTSETSYKYQGQTQAAFRRERETD